MYGSDCESCSKWGMKDKSTLERLEYCRRCRERIFDKFIQSDLNLLHTLKIAARNNRKESINKRNIATALIRKKKAKLY